jgi:calcineurin-like phosphoesterase family protein
MKVRDWYDDYIEEAENMNYYVVSDWHLNHDNIKTYCQRPDNFTELIVKRHNQTVKATDTVIMCGDVCIGKKANAVDLIRSMNGRKILVRGNHDRDKSCGWWMEQGGFDFACDAFKFRQVWFTHEPAKALPEATIVNIHGHLHNIWSGFAYHGENAHEGAGVINVLTGQPFDKPTKLDNEWQRLFAVEYTDYFPIELEKFLARPERYQSIGPKEQKYDTKTSD